MNNIRKFRLEQALKLSNLAKLTGLSQGYICHLEQGTRKNPSYKTMTNISKALNKTVGEVFGI